MVSIGNDWDEVLSDCLQSKDFKILYNKVINEYKTKITYPALENMFRALECTPYNDVKVVILGQDPYHEEDQANGLSFSVNNGVRNPPSLKNIFKELETDLGIIRTDSDLSDWSDQGVLLLNSILTVCGENTDNSKAASHKNLGWELFTDEVIKKLNEKETPVVFVLWGEFAKSKKDLITNPIHKIIESPHPSPFSAHRGFFKSKPFSKINEFLKQNGLEEIDFISYKQEKKR